MKTYFVTKRNTDIIEKVFDGTGAEYINSFNYLLDAYNYCYQISKAAIHLGYEVEELEVISKDEFIQKYGKDAIGLAEE